MGRSRYAVILAGGKGERFWPMSTAVRPKQLLSLVGGRPLVAAAVERLDGLIPPERILVVTGAGLVESARAVLPCMPAENVIGEPVGRDTAAAVTLGAAMVKARDSDGAFCVLTADHVIGDTEIFIRTLSDAFDMAASDVLITIGIKPSFASTGFGYIEAGAPVERASKTKFFEVERFVEKPDAATAKRYVESGSYFWNSGMFIWSVKSYEAALAAHCPALSDMLNAVGPEVGGPRFAGITASVYAGLEKISVDYALMEKASNIVTAQGEFSWDDVGTWTALENHIERDGCGNVGLGAVEILDSSDNVVVSEQGLVALCGVRGLVVVRTADATLVCRKEKAQDVKRIVEILKRKDAHRQWL